MNEIINSAFTAAPASIERETVVIGASAPLLGWYHSANGAPAKDCVAVICNPLGHEYTHSHRALRHLADHLARAGIPTLRFDYHGTGDAPGDALDPDRLQHWQNDIKAALAAALARSGRSRTCLFGVRLGATLAALVAADMDIDYLVLWNPCASGRRYLREMKAIAMTAGVTATTDSAAAVVESAGFILSTETATELQQIDLLKIIPRVRHNALVIGRDDLAEDRSLADKLAADGIAVDYLTLPGYAAMMAEPQFTEVPATALAVSVNWLASKLPAAQGGGAVLHPVTALNFEQPAATGGVALTELPCRFGEHDHLFGIVSYADTADSAKPAIILLNSGSVHHVGPNRLYVTLARTLSARGYTCLRMDIEGLGDSVARSGEARENHPYQDSAIADTDSAMAYLADRFHCRRFIVLGLCSGAHTAFHAGLKLTNRAIADMILINPLTFYWVEGMTLDTTQHFQDVAYYRKSMRNMGSWLKLLRGKVNVFYIAGVALSQLKVRLKASCDSLREVVLRRHTTQLSADIHRLQQQQRPLSLFISGNDPGYDILLAGAKRATLKGIKQNKIHLQFIAGADHTFSRQPRRTDLIERIVAHIEAQFGSPK